MDRAPLEIATPTIYDVAALAGVSIATVSRVLNTRGHARPETRDRVLDAAAELQFVPNGAARQLSSRVKQVLALVFVRPPAKEPGDENDDLAEVETDLLFTDSVIRGAEAAAQQHGYSLLLRGVHAGDVATTTSLTGKSDGLIVLDQVLPSHRVASLAARTPMVLLAGSGRSRSARTVRVDNRGGMEAIAEHLIGTHCLHRLAFMAGIDSSPDSYTRAEAFRSAVEHLGASFEEQDAWWSADWTAAGAADAMRRRIEAGPPLPEGIACANDQMAVGVTHALREAGLRVPADVAVTGFDNIPLARYLRPPLTTVRQPAQQLGAVAVDTLVAMTERSAPPPRNVVLPTHLVVRSSCGCRTNGRGSARPSLA